MRPPFWCTGSHYLCVTEVVRIEISTFVFIEPSRYGSTSVRAGRRVGIFANAVFWEKILP